MPNGKAKPNAKGHPESKNSAMNRARNARKDEFYTQLSDIEKETRHYREHFKGKVVLCNCDDPYASQFFIHFFRKFSDYGLKKLITVCYRNCEPDLFSRNDCDHSIYLEYDGGADESRDPTKEEIAKWVHPLKGDGDFRSAECVALLERSDIVVTNPPFSLFREFVALLVRHNKQFLIVGNVNAISYKECFPLIMQGRLFMGASIHSGDREFGVPDDYPLYAAGCRQDADGRKYIRVKGVRWWTNMDYPERHEDLTLYREYSPKDYPKYDNYDAINVDETKDIPCDYDGVMGVPITFLDKWSPDQFELVGIDRYVKDNPHYGHRFTLKGTETYARILIRRKPKGVCK